ncbi:hypothetical protein K1T71_006791 [Dendrolimus kikuchii]|uniref:Uncharacterized protein n=1 Tax=Dendrolimus kikuchii TaxID=765133 RepID=A0ACC1D207_9NEOP|nr:hypothetical protein K1T71_006791 [Dendrolimus kikuchii]
MAPVYKLKFFDSMGLAEPIRYLFAYGGIPYENIAVQIDKDWINLQQTVPFGKLPVLGIDNKLLFQSVAISRYLGKLVGLLPLDDFESAEMDAIAATVFDFGSRVFEWFHETDDTKKMMLHQELETKIIPRYLTDFEELASGKGGYFGGKKITWADIYFVGIMESVEGMWKKNLLQRQYPMLYQIYNDVHNIPAIKTYISKRPNYKY